MRQTIRRLQSDMKYRLMLQAQLALDFLGLRKNRRLFLPQLVEHLPEGPILCLAPHPDDETLGPGGTLALAASQGADVHVVVITDGSEARPEGPERDERIALRKQEVQGSCKALGLHPPHHLDLPDGNVNITKEAGAKLKAIIDELQPTAVFLPFPIDYHRDHIETNRLLVEATGGQGSFEVWCYETSSPVFPNVIVDISSTIEAKRAAIRAHASQCETNDYVASIADGMNKFRSYGLLAGKGYAEAFYRTDIAFIRDMLRLIDGV